MSNAIGRITSQGVFNGSNWLASSGFSYDAIGRVINNPQWTATINSILQVPYTYDLIGDMTTYGNGGTSWLTFTQSFNAGGRVAQLTSKLGRFPTSRNAGQRSPLATIGSRARRISTTRRAT